MRAGLLGLALGALAPALVDARAAGVCWSSSLAAQGTPPDSGRAPPTRPDSTPAPADSLRGRLPTGDTLDRARALPPATVNTAPPPPPVPTAVAPAGRDTIARSGRLRSGRVRGDTTSARDTSWAGVPPPFAERAAELGDTAAATPGSPETALAADDTLAGSPGLDPAALPQDTLPGLLVTRPLAGGGRLVLYGQPESALVAIRVSFALASGFGPPEALARMAQTLATEEAELGAAPYGASMQMDRTATHASFAITGAAEDAAALAAVLRQAVTWGNWDDPHVRTARLIAAARALRDRETPEPLLRHRLATGLFPELPAEADSVPPLVGASTLHRFWAASFRPDRMQAVVVGRITDAQAAALLGGWPLPRVAAEEAADPNGATAEADAPTPDVGDTAQDVPVVDVSASSQAPAVTPDPPPQQPTARPRRRPTRARRPTKPAPAPTPAPAPLGKPDRPSSVGQPQVLFPWAGVGWPTSADPATAAVAARLVEAHFPAGALRNAHAELWWEGDQRALVLLGSANGPQNAAATPLSVLEAAVAEAASNVTVDEVAAAHLDVARDILFAGRTPAGLAAYLGQMFERTGEPTAGQLFLRQLERVNRGSVERALRRLGTGMAAEVRP